MPADVHQPPQGDGWVALATLVRLAPSIFLDWTTKMFHFMWIKTSVKSTSQSSSMQSCVLSGIWWNFSKQKRDYECGLYPKKGEREFSSWKETVMDWVSGCLRVLLLAQVQHPIFQSEIFPHVSFNHVREQKEFTVLERPRIITEIGKPSLLYLWKNRLRRCSASMTSLATKNNFAI